MQNLILCNLKVLRPQLYQKKRPWHSCFPPSFAKFLRTPLLTEHLRWLLGYNYFKLIASFLNKIKYRPKVGSSNIALSKILIAIVSHRSILSPLLFTVTQYKHNQLQKITHLGKRTKLRIWLMRSSRLLMFFKICVLKHFAIFTGNTCVVVSF